jgi:hypothetical protein|tara:strand:- start:1251 stop:1523 length:273 start_codon:yes stop_codon:yes gene_type:complete
MSIPKITPETLASVTTSMNHDEEYFEGFLEAIKKDNLLIYELIRIVHSASSEGNYKEKGDSYMRGVCTVYKLIESQMEADEMNRIWGDGK